MKFNYKNRINRRYTHTHTHTHTHTEICIIWGWEGGREKKREIYYKELVYAIVEADLEAGSQEGKSTSWNPTGTSPSCCHRQAGRADLAKGEPA